VSSRGAKKLPAIGSFCGLAALTYACIAWKGIKYNDWIGVIAVIWLYWIAWLLLKTRR
jgi:hypothetical protein